MKNGKIHERRKQIDNLPWYKRLRLWFKVDFVFRWIDLKYKVRETVTDKQ